MQRFVCCIFAAVFDHLNYILIIFEYLFRFYTFKTSFSGVLNPNFPPKPHPGDTTTYTHQRNAVCSALSSFFAVLFVSKVYNNISAKPPHLINCI